VAALRWARRAGWPPEPNQAAGVIDDARMVATITTNLMGPIRMTSALIEHLKTRENAVVAYLSSVLGFTPLALTAVYSSTKAAVHSYAMSQRFMLRDPRARDRAALGAHGADEQPRGRGGHAARSVHHRGSGDRR
jgi:NAD(P)-dependent dehydrogenase (short-subunit alcohol dehydrogenase family)